jgi:signal transduction histidine kinase
VNGDADRLREAVELGVSECRNAVLELRALANGLHPSVLTDGGLGAALEEMSVRVPLVATIDDPAHRYPPHIEATAWFVVCEATANALKHARSTDLEVRVAERDGRLHLAVLDDGVGGADASGRGLRGLADRVEAVGGTLAVRTRTAGGTIVEAVLPCAS